MFKTHGPCAKSTLKQNDYENNASQRAWQFKTEEMSDPTMINKNKKNNNEKKYTKTQKKTSDVMNHTIDNRVNPNGTEGRENALLVLPVAFDNQGGLASTGQGGVRPLCPVGSVQELSDLS